MTRLVPFNTSVAVFELSSCLIRCAVIDLIDLDVPQALNVHLDIQNC